MPRPSGSGRTPRRPGKDLSWAALTPALSAIPAGFERSSVPAKRSHGRYRPVRRWRLPPLTSGRLPRRPDESEEGNDLGGVRYRRSARRRGHGFSLAGSGHALHARRQAPRRTHRGPRHWLPRELHLRALSPRRGHPRAHRALLRIVSLTITEGATASTPRPVSSTPAFPASLRISPAAPTRFPSSAT